MIAAAWLMLSTLLYSLQLSTGSFPKPLTEAQAKYARSIEKFVNTPMVMHSGSLKGIIDQFVKYGLTSNITGNNDGSNSDSTSNDDGSKVEFVPTVAEVFYDDGTGFSANKRLGNIGCGENKDYQFCFRSENDVSQGVSAIRFDPVWHNNCFYNCECY